MAYKHDDKSSGQLIRSADWNLMGHELERMETDKVNRAGDTIKGDLKVTGKFNGSEGRFESSLGVGGNLSLGGSLRVDGDIITSADLVGNVAIDDTRDTNEAPSVFGREVSFDFKRRSIIGVPGAGEFSATMTVAPWRDNSGNNHHQLNFNEGGLFWRQGAPQGAWGGWVRLPYDGIKDNFAFRGHLTVGGGFASSNNYMAGGSLTIGNVETNYGGGSNWNSNTAGLLLEAKKNTEIAVHDSGTRVASLLYYEGDADNRITIGRDMGWGTIGEVAVKGRLSVTGTFNASKDPDSAMSNGGLLVLKGNAPQLDFIDTDHNDWSIHVNSNKMYFIRQPWETTDLVLDGAGRVGIGTAEPGAKLDVKANATTWGGWYEAIRFSQASHSAITHPGGGLLFGLHSDRKFYFADTVEGQYIMAIDANPAGGNVGIGTTTPDARLSVYTETTNDGNNTAVFQAPKLGPHASHIHWGQNGDWYIRSASDKGAVVIQDNNGTILIGGNKTGIFARFNDDLWFSDPQNGTIEIKNGGNNNWGTMVGNFRSGSSITYKKDVSSLNAADFDSLLEDTLKTELVRFHYLGDTADTRLKLGVIAEACPSYLVGEEGKTLSPTEYTAMLHGAIKALCKKVAALEQALRDK